MNSIKNFNLLTDLFVEDFTTAYKKIKANGKNRLLKYIESFYRRWYFSALIEDTILTPANLLLLCEEPQNLILQARPALSNYNKISNISFIYKEYTLDRHFVVEDFRILIDSCQPDVELTEDDMLTSEHTNNLLKKLSIYDPFYVEYLILVAFELKAIKKIPAIYSNKAQVTKEVKKLLSKSNKEIFNKIFQVSLDISSRFILNILPLNKKSINRDFIMDLLKFPKSTDDIFQQLYYSLGININDFLDFDSEDMFDDMYSAMMSSTFYLGIILDKYFYTLFGYYLNIINPGYVTPCDLPSEMVYALEAFDNSKDVSVGMFSPCSHYTLTSLGLQMFNLEPTQENSIEFPENVSSDTLIKLLMARLNNSNLLAIDIHEFIKKGASRNDEKVYELKVKLMINKLYWKTFEFLETVRLHEIYLEIAYEFGFDATMNYSFYPDLNENPFSEYTSPNNKRRSKKAQETTLQEMNLSERNKFLLVLYDILNPFTSDIIPVKSIKLEIEFVKSKEIGTDKFYPRVSRTSQAFKNLDFDDWM